MPSNQTANYQLSQWSKDDRVLMDDFNADNAKIDAALGEHATALAALVEASPKHGNCQIYFTTYQGDGTNSKNFGEKHPNTLTFPHKPLWVTIFSPSGRSEFNFFSNDMSYKVNSSSKEHTVEVKWNGNTVTWYATDVFLQMNWSYYTYYVIAFCSMD